MTETSASLGPSYDSINTFFKMLAQTFEVEAEELARALEDGRLTLDMTEDEHGQRYVEATFTEGGQPRTARIYRDRVLRAKANPLDAPP